MRVLVIAAHMDDETFGMGGTIAKHVAAGDQVDVCIACKRAYNHGFTPELVERERSAALCAAGTLGCGTPTFLDLRDELLDERLLDVIVPLEACVDDVRPEVVYTTHRGDTNQDHRAVFQASLVACRSISRHRIRKLLSYEVPSSTDQAPPFPEWAFLPNHFVDISAFLSRKLDAARAYEAELRDFPHPRSARGVETLAAYRGMQAGVAAAEAFIVIRDIWGMILGITPARGGSKDVPRKNVRPLLGKPLIAWTIEAAQASQRIDRYVVSTEDEEIATVARSFGAEVLQRPPELATDGADTLPVLQHALSQVAADTVVLLQATSPVRDPDLIDRCIDLFLTARADSVATGFMCTYVEYGRNDLRRQDIEGFFYDDGNVYVMRADLVLEGDRYGKRIERGILDREQSVEIDDEFDFWLAGQVLARRAARVDA